MRLKDIVIGIGREFALIGIIAGIFLIALYLIIRKVSKNNKETPLWRVILALATIVYLVTVLGAVFSRPNIYETVDLHLFSSYKEAWYNFSAASWRNIILNICMFVPLGILLPLWSKKFHHAHTAVLTGFLFSLSIEILQYLTNRGIFEVDDLFNNTLGTAMGYSIVMLFLIIIKKKQFSLSRLFSYLLIPILTITASVCIFIMYQRQEFGNLSMSCMNPIPMEDIILKNNIDLDEEANQAVVYSFHIADKDEVISFAEEFFGKFGESIDENRTSIFDDTMVFYSERGSKSLWVNYIGKTYSYRNFDIEPQKNNLEDEEVTRKALTEIGITVPAEAIFSIGDNNRQQFTVQMAKSDEKILDGAIQCSCTSDGRIADLTNSIMEYSPVKTTTIISPREAYGLIEEGRFNYRMYQEELKTIELETMTLEYMQDSKQFYQPVYVFHALVNDRESKILIPALKKN